jgi:hypothetical protein
MNDGTNRRSFLSTIGLGALAASFIPDRLSAAELQSSSWDLSWMNGLNGKHRQVFDLDGRHPQKFGNPLRVMRNWMNAHHEVYNLADKELNTCVGITSESFPMNASDPLWTAYPLGEHFEIKDPVTNEWAKRNIWLEPTTGVTANATLRTMVGRGTIFWQCNNALNGVVQELAQRTGSPAEKVRADLVAGLNPWVKLVPAHTMMVGLVQERKFTYQKL